jgi:hypothetical protein
MPADVRETYEEARQVQPTSTRSAAALLRLSIQQLMPHLGQKGKDLNADIGKLVENGLPPMIQQSLDSVRVIGNNAVHPGEINLNDNPEVASILFRLVNLIVEKMIKEPRELKEIYESLPQGAKDQINRRDGATP